MLQTAEIQQRFSHVQQVVNQAEEVCRNDQSIPSEIRDCIQKIAQETGRAESVMQSNDQSTMIQCIDDLEAMGDEAKRVCTTTRPSPQVQSVVVRVHDELSNLKHQMH
jgi:Zn-dependent oligopeptidase